MSERDPQIIPAAFHEKVEADVSLRKLANAYGVSAPALMYLRDRHNISAAVLQDPDMLFPLLIAGGSSGKLRNTLQNPLRRRQIKESIATL